MQPPENRPQSGEARPRGASEVRRDFGRLCRTCGRETGDLSSLFEHFEKDGGNARIDEMLMACASVQVRVFTFVVCLFRWTGYGSVSDVFYGFFGVEKAGA